MLELVQSSPSGLPMGELYLRLSSHRHAVDRAVMALAGQGQLVVQEVAAPDRRGRPRVGLAVVPAAADTRATGPTTLPRFSGQALRRARLRAGVSIAALATELDVTWSAVRWWERSAAVPPARGREIIKALARLQRQVARHRPADDRIVRRLHAARAAVGWSQARLAAALGVSQSTVSNWESGNGLTRENALRIHRVLARVPPAAHPRAVVARAPR